MGRDAVSRGAARSRSRFRPHVEVDGPFWRAFRNQSQAVQGTREPGFLARDRSRDKGADWVVDVDERLDGRPDSRHCGLRNSWTPQTSGKCIQLDFVVAADARRLT